MRTFLGFIAWHLVVYGPRWCRNPYTALGRWCLSGSGDWTYREDRIRVESELIRCPGCNRKYHPSWGSACGNCTGAQ